MNIYAVKAAWKSYDQWIEADADAAAYEAASPENALVLIGPNRASKVSTTFDNLTPVGLLQNFTIGQNINWVAQQMIGSARTFFLAGKAPGNGSISRLFTSRNTLLGAIYASIIATLGKSTTAVVAGGLSANMESKAYDQSSKIIFTLDSELIKIPFGMACLFRDTVRNNIGGFYVEHMVIPNLNLGFAVGQPAILESCNVLFDRVVPYDILSTLGSLNTPNMQTAFDAAIGGQAVAATAATA